MASGFEATTITYIPPMAGTDMPQWQLAGPDQNAHPVTLRRGVRGLWGPPVDVETRRVLQSRHTYRVGTKPKQLTIELPVHIVTPDYGQFADVPVGFLTEQWMRSWPSDMGTSAAPLAGTLKVDHPQYGSRYLDVYRTEEFEVLTNMDPRVAGSMKMLVVCASNDPYPRSDVLVEQLRDVSEDTRKSRWSPENGGDVAISPKVYVEAATGGEVAVSVIVKPSDILKPGYGEYAFYMESQKNEAQSAKFKFNVPGSGCFDLDPAQLTFTPGKFNAKAKRFQPSGNARGLHWSGAASEARPIGLPWGQSAAVVVPPRWEMDVEVKKATGLGNVYVDHTYRYERLWG